MTELLSRFDSDQLLGVMIALPAVVGGLLCAIIAIIAGNWKAIRHAETSAALKQDMLNRGMSADEIRTVIEAGSKVSSKDLRRQLA